MQVHSCTADLLAVCALWAIRQQLIQPVFQFSYPATYKLDTGGPSLGSPVSARSRSSWGEIKTFTTKLSRETFPPKASG